MPQPRRHARASVTPDSDARRRDNVIGDARSFFSLDQGLSTSSWLIFVAKTRPEKSPYKPPVHPARRPNFDRKNPSEKTKISMQSRILVHACSRISTPLIVPLDHRLTDRKIVYSARLLAARDSSRRTAAAARRRVIGEPRSLSRGPCTFFWRYNARIFFTYPICHTLVDTAVK